jgi:hypothetical protein
LGGYPAIVAVTGDSTKYGQQQKEVICFHDKIQAIERL